MPTLKELTEEAFDILRDSFNEAEIWEGEEDVSFVKSIAEKIGVERYKMLTGTPEEKNTAASNLKFLEQWVKNEITTKQIKLKGFGESVLTAIVKTATKVLISTAIGML